VGSDSTDVAIQKDIVAAAPQGTREVTDVAPQTWQVSDLQLILLLTHPWPITPIMMSLRPSDLFFICSAMFHVTLNTSPIW
jgi:hypothetical protein